MHAIVTADTVGSAATRLAVRSLRRHHPDATVTVLATDPTAPVADVDTGVSILAARDLHVGELRYLDAWLCGGPAFARWAVVPAAVRAVRSASPGVGPILVVPGSAWVRANVDDLVDGVADEHVGVAARGHDPASGATHHGFVTDVAVVGSSSEGALRWWESAAVAVLLEEPADGRSDELRFDDPWQVFVNGSGPFEVLTDPTIRLSPASVEHLDGDAVERARVAQFPGFDPHRPWWYSTSPDLRPAVLASERPELRRLCLDYAEAVLAGAGHDAGPPPAGGLLGIDHGPELRARLRAELRRAVADDRTPRNPLDPETATAFYDWMRDPAASLTTGISPAADVVWARRPDLAAAFPHVRWNDRDAFVRWLWTYGLQEGLISTAVLPPRPPVPEVPAAPSSSPAAEPAGPRFGVNLVGYHDAELGLGVAVRRVGAALDAAGIPWTRVTYDRSHSRRRSTGDPVANTADAPYHFNLILVAPDQLQYFADDVGPAFFEGRHNIGLWYWETDAMSRRQIEAFDLVDEVWGSTKYLADVFAGHTAKPVAHVPVPLEFAPTTAGPAARARLGLDDRFTFLFSFDFLSIVQRKNPLGLVQAYRDAFGPDDGCRLVLKSINGDRHVAEAEELRAAFADRSDIELWDRYLDGPDRIDLVANVDCYVSLHRSEGLGLTMAEAMSAGTPVIATGYSGNVDFMPSGAALLVDHEVVRIGPGSFYPAEGHWAEPDLAHAAALMRRVRHEPALRDELRRRGPQALAPFTVKRVGAAIEARLRELWR